jgi:hypothetical protein
MKLWQIREMFRLLLDLRDPNPSGVNGFNVFEQDTWWQTRDHRWLRLTQMAPSHRKNTLLYLDKRFGAVKNSDWSDGWLYQTKIFLGLAYLVRIDGTMGNNVDAYLKKAREERWSEEELQ